jgi:hypothetical protein
MGRLRRQLGIVTVAVAILQTAIVTFGALRPCWSTEHTHAGTTAPECPMHHHQPAHAPQAGQHHHGGSTEDGARVTCRCSNDPATPYLGPSAIVVQPPSMLPTIQIAALPAEGRLFRTDVRFSPPAPPPRSTFSSNS